MKDAREKPFVIQWREAFMSSSLAATTKLVLHTLGAFMDASNGRCFPSVKTIMAMSSLSNKAVITHLEKGALAGWILKISHPSKKGASKGWRRHHYEAKIPGNVVTESHHHDAALGGERCTPPKAHGGEPQSNLVVNEVHTNSKKNSIYTKPFLTFWENYPRKVAKKTAFKAWQKNRPSLNECLKAIEAQIAEKAALKTKGEFCPEWKHPATWINRNCWEDEPTIKPKVKRYDSDF